MVGDIMQPTHLLFVLVVALLVLGPKRLPEVGRQLGNGIRDFRNAINGEREERHPVVEESYTVGDSGYDPTSAASGEHRFAHEPAATAEPGRSPAPEADRTAASETARAPEAGPDAAPGSAGEHQFAHEAAGRDAAGPGRVD